MRDLLDRIAALELHAQQHEAELLDRDRAWHKYEDSLHHIQMALSEARQQMAAASHSIAPLGQKLDENEVRSISTNISPSVIVQALNLRGST